MSIQVIQIDPGQLGRYARISIAFRIDRVLAVDNGGLGGLRLVERPVEPAYDKDYDAVAGEGPTTWPDQWDLTHWGLFMAVEGGRDVGAAAAAMRTPPIHMLEGREDLACLWDIRVDPAARGRGVGAALLQHAAGWARDRGARQLKIETQNTNVRACRFYAAQGCRLRAIDTEAYSREPAVAHEAMLIWMLDLEPPATDTAAAAAAP